MSTDNSSSVRRLIGWVFLFVVLLLVVSLSKGIVEILSVYDRVESVEAEVADLEEEKVDLEQQFAERLSPGYVERQIRNELHLSRPGEIVVVMPEKTVIPAGEVRDEEIEVEKENWQKWMEIFL